MLIANMNTRDRVLAKHKLRTSRLRQCQFQWLRAGRRRFFFVVEPAEEAEDPVAGPGAAEDDHRHENGAYRQWDDDHLGGEDLADQGMQPFCSVRAGCAA
jgi:hypothetical protein